MARKPWADPYQLANDVHLLLSRSNDVIRLWNAGTVNAVFTEDAMGQGLVQVINYATRASGQPVSMWVARPYKTALIVNLSGRDPEPLTVTPKADGVDVNLPPFDVYSAIGFGV